MRHLLTIALLLSALLATAQVDLSTGWRFRLGDDPAWAEPDFADTIWSEPVIGETWETQGFADYDGHAWYRVHFHLPASLREKAKVKDGLRLLLGTIDDCDMTYLNGQLIGQTGQFIYEPEYASAWDKPRRYAIPADHPALRWDADNVLAVRVYDGGGPGGIFGPGPRNLDMTDVMDFLNLDATSEPFVFVGKDSVQKTVFLENAFSRPVEGEYTVQVTAQPAPSARVEVKGKEASLNDLKPAAPKAIFEQKTAVTVKAGERLALRTTFPRSEGAVLSVVFSEKKTGKTLRATAETPYILTPPEPLKPRINNAQVYGARPGTPFRYTIAASGQRPMMFEASGLPPGFKINPATGIISGSTKERGMYNLTLKATNSIGSDTKLVNVIIGDNIALTPPLGWNSWNCWGLSVSDERVRASADAMLSSGLANHGWSYMNIDDGWEAPERHPKTGAIMPNEKFPNMDSLCDYVHSLGLNIGIYSSPGSLTCGGYLGSWQHEQQDAQTWADWGIDYLKYDWCSYGQIAPKPTLDEMKKPYQVMRAALSNINRDIVYSLCQYGMGDVWQWGEEVGGNLWRTTGDITDTWASLRDIGFQQAKCSPYARPGHWNDPDMLIVGWVGWGDKLHQTRLSPTEQYTHLSLWAMLSAPLLIGCDLTRIDPFTYNLLANHEVLAIDQDALGKQAVRVFDQKEVQIWVKELADGSRAVAVFNLSEENRAVRFDWTDLGLPASYTKLRDVWRQQDLGKLGKSFETEVLAHGVRLLRVE